MLPWVLPPSVGWAHSLTGQVAVIKPAPQGVGRGGPRAACGEPGGGPDPVIISGSTSSGRLGSHRAGWSSRAQGRERRHGESGAAPRAAGVGLSLSMRVSREVLTI